MSTEAPRPDSDRWRPLRIGLVDLFYYDIEEFHCHGGSLLLRGNNGTGKSKVLALTMPFLLDGELAAHRVEPDGDRNKRMEWNLLLGGRYEHPERVGYTWMEFGRRDPDGTEHFTTIGAGLKAVAGRGIVRHWFFVTSQRIGAQLSLLTPARTALTRERLKEAVADQGMVYDRAVDYRRAVDEALFGLGSRYDTLVTLLIQLRAPQLTKRPDEKLLSRALTDALPPLDENLVTQVAEAFRGLDDEREALEGLNDVRGAAVQFLTLYRRYARTAAKRKAAAPRRTHGQHEEHSQQLTAALRELDEATAKLATAKQRLADLSTRRAELEARQRTLLTSPEARSREELARAEELARTLEHAAETRHTAMDRLESDVARWALRVQSGTAELDTAGRSLAAALETADATADEARISQRHRLGVSETVATGPSAYARARRAGAEAVEWRRQSLTKLDALVGSVEEEVRRLAQAREEEDRCRSEVAQAAERLASAERAVGSAAADLVASVHRYLAGLVRIRVLDAPTLLSTLEEWAMTAEGANPAVRAVQAAADTANRELAEQRVRAEQEQALARRQIADIDEELDLLRAGGHPAPPGSHTRTADRSTRAGAPLWSVIDFKPEVSAADRAGIEAAMEAAGLLDSWVSPDGALLGSDDDDVLVVPRVIRPSGEVLASALEPAIDPGDSAATALPERLVADILASVGLGAQSTMDTWVSPDGSFRLGVLEGRWRKESAAYIGEGARAEARRARIAALTEQREFAELVVVDCEARLAELVEQLEDVVAERSAMPGDGTLREAHSAVRHERAGVTRTEEALTATVRRVGDRRAAADDAARAAEEFAVDVGLAPSLDDIVAVRAAVQRYEVALAQLWPALTARDGARATLDGARTEHEEATQRCAEAREEYEQTVLQATAARAAFNEMEAAVGVAVKELQQRLAKLESELLQCASDETRTRAAESAATEQYGEANGRQGTLRATLTKIDEDRHSAVNALRAFASTGLLKLACPDVEVPDPSSDWAPTPAVAVARAIDRALADVDDGDRRWELDQQAVNTGHKTLADGLSRHGHRALLTVRDDAMLVEVAFQGRTQQVSELTDALEDEIAERERVLSARHREILENQLVNEVAASLQELVVAAEAQVAHMNAELESRPTSTGMRLRLVWRAAGDAPAGLPAIREKLLRQNADVWTGEDRRRLGDFLEEQIKAERLRDTAATWAEQLTNALDYRSWHEFAIQRHQDGQWRSATGPASGGERVLAASVPLFAAASSYYASSGNPRAPRLIALDEAFAGVDDDSRAKCLGLLATFDLDVMMTSEREWGCYPEVPGLAIAQLARRDGIDAVLVTPWRWNGAVRVQVPRPTPYVPKPADPPSVDQSGSEQPDLFG